jgi:radical SAM superfamily enzyme YgiQ (UPF0313 family)
LNPPFHASYSRSERSPQVSKSGTLYFPVWLAQAAAYVEKCGAEIGFLDAIASQKDLKGVLDWLRAGQADCLVMETSTASLSTDLQTASSVKQAFPDLLVVLSGSHVSALPEETMARCEAVDVVVRGEYETPLADLSRALSAGSGLAGVRGIAYREDGRVMMTAEAPLLEDLDEIPFPSILYKRFLDIRKYYFAAALWPGVMLMTGRGCPNRCMWCLFNQTMHGRRYRFRSPANIVSEFEYIAENFPDVREVWIDDDTFTVNKQHLAEVCELIVRRRLAFRKGPFQWYCNARPPLDPEQMKRMRRAGCRLLVTGFESGDPQILRNMQKGFTVEQAQQFMRDARAAGLLVHGCFVVGNPGETRQTMERTLEFAKALMPDSAQFYFVHPYPGTEYYRWAVEKGYLAARSFDEWLDESGNHRCVIELPGLSSTEIKEFCNRAYRAFHFHPRYLGRKLVQLVSQPEEGVRSLRSGFQFLFRSIRTK